jgi:hypothetical protein
MFDYLSSTWRQVRRQAIQQAGGKCEVPDCGATFPLHVHHKRGVSQFPELAYQSDNLIVYCAWHHARAHGYAAIPRHWWNGVQAANDDQFELDLRVGS